MQKFKEGDIVFAPKTDNPKHIFDSCNRATIVYLSTCGRFAKIKFDNKRRPVLVEIKRLFVMKSYRAY